MLVRNVEALLSGVNGDNSGSAFAECGKEAMYCLAGFGPQTRGGYGRRVHICIERFNECKKDLWQGTLD